MLNPCSPQCPQNHVEADHLLRIPEELGKKQEEGQDEFRCLNVNVSLPSGQSTTKELLPVLIWIHGKTQYVYELDMSKCISVYLLRTNGSRWFPDS